MCEEHTGVTQVLFLLVVSKGVESAIWPLDRGTSQVDLAVLDETMYR